MYDRTSKKSCSRCAGMGHCTFFFEHVRIGYTPLTLKSNKVENNMLFLNLENNMEFLLSFSHNFNNKKYIHPHKPIHVLTPLNTIFSAIEYRTRLNLAKTASKF